VNVSAKSEYGLRSLVYLAQHAQEGLTPAREIAKACGVPIKYLEQILGVLRDGRVVEAQVGSAGGYRLARPARFISAGEAIRLLDERLGLGEAPPALGRRGDDPIRRLWERIEAAVVAVVDDVSIEDLARATGSGPARERTAG
jgi:Rrf2 family cysteine metabolism transcriptional repressor